MEEKTNIEKLFKDTMVLEVGVENITIFEKFYLDQNIEIRKK